MKVLSFALLAVFSTSVLAGESKKLEAISHFNKYSNVGYNDCWGYTDENGREYALLGVLNGTSIIDITDSKNIKEIAFIKSNYSTWKDIKTYKHYAYVVNESGGGMQIIDLSKLPESAELVNTYKKFSTSHNLWIDVENAMLYAEGSHSQPVRLISLEDPVNPVQVGSFGVEAHDMYARDNIAYISEGGHGTIGIFDTSDPEAIENIGRFEIPNAGYVHNAWLTDSGDFLMTTEETNRKTVKIWDIRHLEDVVLVGEYLAKNNLAHNTHIKGNFAYISHYGAGLRIVDIRNPYDPVEVAYFMEQEDEQSGFVDDWGAFPFFESGKVLVSDIDSGLYVVQFDSE